MRNTADQAVKMYFKILKIFRLFGAMLKKEQEKREKLATPSQKSFETEIYIVNVI